MTDDAKPALPDPESPAIRAAADATTAMQPLASWDARDVLGVLTDVDDTLTDDGRLRPATYEALWRLHEAGLRVIPVTGRSAGWAHLMIRQWPVDAVVAESGGVYLLRESAASAIQSHFHADPARVAADRAALQACASRVMAAVPGLKPASDNAFRSVDIALDHAEEVPPVPPVDIERALAMFRAEGFSARASSVHINAWAGQFDKAPTALQCLRHAHAGTPLADPDRWVFIGDAPNDASMFSALRHTVGVANIVAVRHLLPRPPVFVTRGFGGDGFVEFVDHLLASRGTGR